VFSRILIANRGEIACRIARTARAMGVETVAVFSDADREALHVAVADEAVAIAGKTAAESYLNGDKIIEAARKSGAEAIHPGYGFLAENAGFAEACEAAGLVFIGPPASAIAAMGDKIAAKKIAEEAGVPIIDGHPEPLDDPKQASAIARRLGYPVMLKAAAGGGGKGMRVAANAAEIREGLERARSEARASFGDERVFLEKYIERPRHIEIQILADEFGTIVHLGERECSIQRRHQKVIEEAPSPAVDDQMRAEMGAKAIALARAVGYRSAGTVEFIVDGEGEFHFLEMNTRLQVEHPVTELVAGLDLVEWMLRIAAGEALDFKQDEVKLSGVAMEARLYAEDPYRHDFPSTGRLRRFRPPRDAASELAVVRIDAGVEEGGEISRLYDPMIGKVVVWGPTRRAAIGTLSRTLDEFEIDGVAHNIPLLSAVLEQPRFVEGQLDTGYLGEAFGGGFEGVAPDEERLMRLAGLACCAAIKRESRDRGAAGEPGEVRQSVVIGERRFDFTVKSAGDFFALRQPEETTIEIETGWGPGEKLARVWVGGAEMIVGIDRLTAGFRLRYRGTELVARVLRPEVADLMVLMPPKPTPDVSRLLLCPMPGQVVHIEVGEGELVEYGQPLAIVEAMKMENVLRAERRARVKRLVVEVGAVLAVDEVIMEFEEA